MSESIHCPKCGTRLPEDAPAELCPKCLVEAGFESESQAESRGEVTPPSRGSGFEPPSAEELGRRFPQLEILELLGKGGMGAVYKARQPNLDRLVAVKILPPEVGSDPTFAERFTREARAMAHLSHPNIVAVHDFGEAQGTYYFVMEYVDGVNLRQTIQAGTLQPKQALAIVPQICDALQYAHDAGIVHRDIKPENILLDQTGRLKIADFGLSKVLNEDRPDVSLTGTHQVMGTLRYMAPEQMEGSRDVDHRADIYSLGVVFYEMLTGELPIGRFQPPSQKVQIDVRLDEVVLRSLEKEPERRYQHASDLRVEVEHVSDHAASDREGAQEALPGASRFEERSDYRVGSEELEKRIYEFFENRKAPIVRACMTTVRHVLLICVVLGTIAWSISIRSELTRIGLSVFMVPGIALLAWSATGLLLTWLDYRCVENGDRIVRRLALRMGRHGFLAALGFMLLIFLIPAGSFPFWWVFVSIGIGFVWYGGAGISDVWDRHRASRGAPRMWDDPEWTLFDTGVVFYAAFGMITLISNPFIPGLSAYDRINLVCMGLILWLPQLFIIVARIGRRHKVRGQGDHRLADARSRLERLKHSAESRQDSADHASQQSDRPEAGAPTPSGS